MNTRKKTVCGVLAVILALMFLTCGDDPDTDGGGNKTLTGEITISPAGPLTINIELTATYTGDEEVSYQWKKDNGNVGTNSDKYTPTEAGSYTVTVSASGYNSKTSAAVIVNLPITVEGSNLAAKLTWLSLNAASNSTYILEVSADEAIAPHTLSYADKSNITIILKGSGTQRIVSLSSSGSLFTVESGVTMVLDENIILQGISSNNTSLIRVDSGGTLKMEDGSKITGNTNNNTGGGVSVNEGTFTMSGGEISGNTAEYGGGVCITNEHGTFIMVGGKISSNTAAWTGGGVQIWRGTFTMNNGKISDNTTGYGGGVCVNDGGLSGNGTFNLNDGEISGNTSNKGGGGGVNVGNDGIFVMQGGKISDNSADADSWAGGGGVNVFQGTFTMASGEISDNTVSGGECGGGGVYVYEGTFAMQGGKISGNIAASVEDDFAGGGGVNVSEGTFTMTGGEISGNVAEQGGGVYVYNTTFCIVTGTIYGADESNTNLGNTADNSAALAVHGDIGTAEHGTFSGETWTSNGTLTSTDGMISVVNGEFVE